MLNVSSVRFQIYFEGYMDVSEYYWGEERCPETYFEPYQTSKMELFAKILQPSTFSYGVFNTPIDAPSHLAPPQF